MKDEVYPAHPVNPFECPASRGKCYSFFIPLAQRHAGKEIEVCLLDNKDCAKDDLTSEVWVSAYPAPYASRQVVLSAYAGTVWQYRLAPDNVSDPNLTTT